MVNVVFLFQRSALKSFVISVTNASGKDENKLDCRTSLLLKGTLLVTFLVRDDSFAMRAPQIKVYFPISVTLPTVLCCFYLLALF